MSKEDWQDWDRGRGELRGEAMLNVTKTWHKIKAWIKKASEPEHEYEWTYEHTHPGCTMAPNHNHPYCPGCGGRLTYKEAQR